MNHQQVKSLEQKRALLLQKIQIDKDIQNNIVYHWLDYYHEIQALNMQAEIVYIHQCAAEQIELYKARINALANANINAEKVLKKEVSYIDQVFARFPTCSHFKYELDTPYFDESGNVKDSFSHASELLNVHPQEVLFFSCDFHPVVKLNWQELLANGDALFDDGGRVNLIFTDPELTWIILRNIEERWFYSKWQK